MYMYMYSKTVKIIFVPPCIINNFNSINILNIIGYATYTTDSVTVLYTAVTVDMYI